MGAGDGWFDNIGRVVSAARNKTWKRSRNCRSKTALQAVSQTVEQSQINACRYKVEGNVKVQMYAAPTLDIVHLHNDVARRQQHHDHVHLHCEVEFDPVKDYAQVLAEARSHLEKTPGATGSFEHSSHPSPLSRQPHLDVYKELHSKLGKLNRTSKLRRYFFFWQKWPSYHEKQVEKEFDRIFLSPLHPSAMTMQSKPSGKASNGSALPRKGTSGPLNSCHLGTCRKNSGPLYTDGLPVSPANRSKLSKKSHSGPLGRSSNWECSLPSPYQPLQHTTTPSCSPLYFC